MLTAVIAVVISLASLRLQVQAQRDEWMERFRLSCELRDPDAIVGPIVGNPYLSDTPEINFVWQCDLSNIGKRRMWVARIGAEALDKSGRLDEPPYDSDITIVGADDRPLVIPSTIEGGGLVRFYALQRFYIDKQLVPAFVKAVGEMQRERGMPMGKFSGNVNDWSEGLNRECLAIASESGPTDRGLDKLEFSKDLESREKTRTLAVRSGMDNQQIWVFTVSVAALTLQECTEEKAREARESEAEKAWGAHQP